MEFNLDGTLKFVELDIVNLNNNAYWEKVPFVVDNQIVAGF